MCYNLVLMQSLSSGTLARTHFYRVIADEAQFIRNRYVRVYVEEIAASKAFQINPSEYQFGPCEG